jgi:hypothetical protein
LQEQKDGNKLLHSITSEQNQQHHWDQIPDTNPKCQFHPRTVNSNQQNELWSNLWIRTYRPQAITTKNDETISISEVKRMDIRGCNKSHLHDILFLRITKEKNHWSANALFRPSVVNRGSKKIAVC